MDFARCKDVDADIFFPLHVGELRKAVAVCAECAVREECLAYALREEILFGVWGGLSEKARRDLFKAQRAASRQKLKKVK